jgi:rhomboid protease GluP
MLNEPSQNDERAERRSHPLEDRDQPTPPTAGGQPRQQIMLHIPTVRPLVTYGLVGIMVLVFVLRALSPQFDAEAFLWGANNQRAVFEDGEFYRLFTSMFLHASIYNPFGGLALQNSIHLIFNAYILFVTGGSVERFFGHLRFKIIFVLGGLTGSILSCLLSDVFSVGASGAVFAILGAEFAYLYKHRKLLGKRGEAQRSSLITLAVINLAIGVLSSLGGGGMRIDNWAHLGGALGGLALGWWIGPDLIFRRHPTIPTELMAEDNNPLRKHYRTVSLYVALLLALLIVGSQIVTT